MRKLTVFLTAWFFLAATAAAHADPVTTLLFGAAFAATTAGALVSTALSIAFSIGVGLLQKALNKQPNTGPKGVKQQVSVGGDNPLSVILGHYATPGQLEYVNTWGKNHEIKNSKETRVYSLADLPVGSLTGIWGGDTKGTLPDMTGTPPTDQGWPVTEFQSKGGSDYLWIKFYDGTQTEADPWLLSQFGGDADRPYTSDMIGKGVPYVIVTARFSPNIFSGFPDMLFETDGARLYDIRKDTSAGGDGDHRWDDQSTWEVSDNPIVHVYNICRGIYYGDEWVWGGQSTEAFQLPETNWMAAMNAADLDIDLADGGTEKQFRAGREISVDEQPLDVIEDYMKGCSGRFAEVGGIYKVLVGAPGAAVYSFTDDHIIISKEQSFDPFPGLEQTFNGAQASYPEPDEKWGMKDAPAYYRSDLEVLDDNRRLVTGLQFPTVPYAVQVQRLLKAAVEDSRRFKQHQFYLPPDAWLLEPNDVVSWTSARNGYVEKKFLVTSIAGGSNFLQLVNLKEIDPTDYDWTAATDEQSFSITPIGPIVPAPQVMEGWSAEPTTVKDNDGNNRRPAIKVSFSATQDDVQFVRVQVRLDGETDLQFDGTAPYGVVEDDGTKSVVISFASILPNTDYEVRGIFVPYSGRETLWSNQDEDGTEGAWLGVTTDDIRFGSLDIDVDQINEDITGLIEWIGPETRDIVNEMRAMAANAASQDLAGYSNLQTLRRQLVATAGDLTADYDEKIDAATGPGSALVQSVETLTATVAGKADASTVSLLQSTVTANGEDIDANTAAITSLTATVAGKADATALTALTATVTSHGTSITANSNAITALDTTVGNFSASGIFRVSTETTESGASATIGLSASASEGGATEAASLFISALTGGGSRVTVVADQFVVTDGTNTQNPFLFTGGEAYLNVANIGTITAGVIKSPDELFVITVADGKLEWFEAA